MTQTQNSNKAATGSAETAAESATAKPATPTEKIFIISDIEMGRGDLMDDFHNDQLLIDFINKINSESTGLKTALVLNGDTLDFMKMAYKDTYHRYITEEISLWKLTEIIRVHSGVFEAWKNFLKDPLHSLHFVIGNHDADLIWPQVQEKIRNTLAAGSRIFFDYHFNHKDIHAEHGHLADPFFHIDIRKPIIKYQGKKILNLAWGYHAACNYLVHIKEKFPLEETMFPKAVALQENSLFKKESRKMVLSLALNEILLNPLIHFFDPTYSAPYRKFIKHVFMHGLEFIDDRRFLGSYIRQISKQNPNKQIIVLGHLHLFGIFNYRKHRCIVTDTWRNEVSATNAKEAKIKTFAEITYNNNDLQSAELKTYT